MYSVWMKQDLFATSVGLGQHREPILHRQRGRKAAILY